MRRVRFLSTLALLLALAGCGGVQKMKTIPAELHGVWQTGADPKFDGHTFEMKDSAIVITAAEEATIEQAVVRVEKRNDGGKSLYTIYALTPEHEADVWNLYFESENGGTIRFVSQKSIEWTRQIPAATAAPVAPASTPVDTPESPAESRK